MSAEDFDLLLKGRPHIEVVTHQPGHIRLKFDFAIVAAAPEMASRGEDVLRAIGGIHDVDASLFTRTVAIAYDPEVLPPAWWDQLYGPDDAAAEAVVEKLKQTYA